MDSAYLLGVFDDEDAMLSAFRKMKEQEIEIEDVFTPYPIHEILEKHGRKSRLTIVGWFYGFFATIGVLALSATFYGLESKDSFNSSFDSILNIKIIYRPISALKASQTK